MKDADAYQDFDDSDADFSYTPATGLPEHLDRTGVGAPSLTQPKVPQTPGVKTATIAQSQNKSKKRFWRSVARRDCKS